MNSQKMHNCWEGGRGGEKRKFERDALMHLFQMIRSSIVKYFVIPAIFIIMKFWLPINVLPIMATAYNISSSPNLKKQWKSCYRINHPSCYDKVSIWSLEIASTTTYFMKKFLTNISKKNVINDIWPGPRQVLKFELVIVVQ